MEVSKYGKMGIWEYENMEIWKYGNMKIWKYGKKSTYGGKWNVYAMPNDGDFHCEGKRGLEQ